MDDFGGGPAPAELVAAFRREPVSREMLDRMAEQVGQLEAALQAMATVWPDRLALLRTAMPEGLDRTIDATVETVAEKEKRAAAVLADFRRADRNHRHVPAELVALGARIEEVLIRQCEQYRDVRWDLMALQSEKRDRSKDQPFTGASDLRRQVLAAR